MIITDKKRKLHKAQSERKILPKNTADKEMASTMYT
jgi:hypothetical protein